MNDIPLDEAAKVESRQTEIKRSGLHFIQFADIEPRTNIPALIKGVIFPQSMSVVYGESNTGKTFLALDMALKVALEMEWHGKKTKQAGVVYVAAEGGHSVSNRVVAFKDHHGLDDTRAHFALVPCSVDLCLTDADTKGLISLIAEAATAFEVPVGLVVIDTLSRALAGGNENDSADMGAFVKNIDSIRDATGGHLMIVHHSGKDGSKGARGHSLLRAATDTEIEVKDGAAKVTKQRDWQGGDEFPFDLVVVEVGTDSDGEPVTSCVVEPGDRDVIASKVKAPREDGPQGQAYVALRDAIDACGEVPPASSTIPEHTKAVKRETWVRFAEQRFEAMYDSNRRTYQMNRALVGIVGRHVGTSGPWLWLY
jgi:hypothetical protein